MVHAIEEFGRDYLGVDPAQLRDDLPPPPPATEMKTKGGHTYAEWVWIIASEMTRPDPQIHLKERRLSSPKTFGQHGLEGSARFLVRYFEVSIDEAKVDITLALREYTMHLPMPGAPQGFRAMSDKVNGCPVCYPDASAGVPRELTWLDKIEPDREQTSKESAPPIQLPPPPPPMTESSATDR